MVRLSSYRMSARDSAVNRLGVTWRVTSLDAVTSLAAVMSQQCIVYTCNLIIILVLKNQKRNTSGLAWVYPIPYFVLGNKLKLLEPAPQYNFLRKISD